MTDGTISGGVNYLPGQSQSDMAQPVDQKGTQPATIVANEQAGITTNPDVVIGHELSMEQENQLGGPTPGDPRIPKPRATLSAVGPKMGSNAELQERSDYFTGAALAKLPPTTQGNVIRSMMQGEGKSTQDYTKSPYAAFLGLGEQLAELEQFNASIKGLPEVTTAAIPPPILTAMPSPGKVDFSANPADIMKQISANLLETMTGAQTALDQAQTILVQSQTTTPESSQKSTLDYLQMIEGAISEAKQLITELANQDAKRSEKEGKAQTESTLAKLDENLKKLDKQAKQLKAAAKAAKKGKVLNVVMAVLGPITAVVMAAAAVVSGGVLLALMVTAVSVTLMQVNSATHFIEKGSSALMKGIGSLLGDMGIKDKGLQEVISAMVMVAVIVATVIATRGAAAKGATAMLTATTEAAAQGAVQGAAKSMTTQVLTKLGGNLAQAEAQQLAQFTAFNISLQVGVTMVTSSNAISIIVSRSLEEAGVSKSTAELIGMLLQMLTILGACLAGGIKGGSMVEGMSANVLRVNQNVTNATNVAGEALTGVTTGFEAANKIIDAKFQLRDAQYKREIADLGLAADQRAAAADMYKAAKEVMSRGQANLMDQASSLTETLDGLLAGISQTVRRLMSI